MSPECSVVVVDEEAAEVVAASSVVDVVAVILLVEVTVEVTEATVAEVSRHIKPWELLHESSLL